MIKLLDCTIRDGGYYTSWDFDDCLIKEYFQLLNKLPYEYLEIGYRSIEKEKYLGEYFYLPCKTIRKIRELTTKKLSIMINSKDCIDIDLKELLNDIKDEISLIRIAIDPRRIDFGLELAKTIKSLGFEVTFNVMYISRVIEDSTFIKNLTYINQYVDYLYLVDSYGSIYPDELEILIKNIQAQTDISLGFHGHDNLELAYANTLTAIYNGVEIIDSTVLGMGRGAGNLKTELMLSYLKSRLNVDIDLNILGRLTELFKPLHEQYRWGTNLAYMVSGCYSLPQKDVMEALEINRYSLTGIINHIKNDKNLTLPKLKFNGNTDSCIIIGGGFSINHHIDAIREYLFQHNNVIVIHSTSKYINCFKDLKNIQFFAVAGDELLKIDKLFNYLTYVLEPIPRKVNCNISNIKNFYELEKINFINKYFDSPLTISLQIALDLCVQNIYLVGYDGYKHQKNKKELYLMQENQEIINTFLINNELFSYTKSNYKNLKEQSIYAKI